jgi:hypothetical protein
MSGFAAIIETVRNTWHAARRLAAGQGEIVPSPAASPVAGAAPGLGASFESAAPQRIDRMMQAFGIDSQELQRDYPRVLRDANVTCLHCKSKRRCLRELDAGTAAANAEQFCPNADLFAIFADGQETGG